MRLQNMIPRVLFLLILAGVRVTAFDASHGCGVGHRSIAAALDQIEVEQSASSQRYQWHRSPSDLHDVESDSGRAMSAEPFIPLSTLDAMNLSRPIRMRVLWDVVDTGDAAVGGSQEGLSYQCNFVGEAILVRGTNGLFVMSPEGFCAAQHIVTGTVGSARGALIRARTADAVAFYAAAIRVRPVLDDAILLSAPVLSAVFKLNVSAVADADVVVVMTARPSPNAPLAGYAACLQRYQLGRCTVAWVNWCVTWYRRDVESSGNLPACLLTSAQGPRGLLCRYKPRVYHRWPPHGSARVHSRTWRRRARHLPLRSPLHRRRRRTAATRVRVARR